MWTLPEILQQLQSISYDTALVGLYITAGIIIITRDWRLLIFALLLQYVLSGIILSGLVQFDLAVLQIMIGAFICPILFLSALQVAGTSVSIHAWPVPQPVPSKNKVVAWWRRVQTGWLASNPDRRRQIAPTGTRFRGIVGLLLILIANVVGRSFPLSTLALAITIAVYWLILAGLVVLILTEDPLKAGHGLFTILTGFGLYYTTLENSLLLTGMWGAVNLLLALAVGYLIVVRGTGAEEEL